MDNEKLKQESGLFYSFGKLSILHGHELGICPRVNPAHRYLERAKAGMRYAAQHIVVFGPVWERNELGNVIGAKYRVGDTYPAGYDAIWSRSVSKELEFADAQGSAVAA